MLSIKKGKEPSLLAVKHAKYKKIEKEKNNWYEEKNEENVKKLYNDYKKIKYDECINYSDNQTKSELKEMCTNRCFICGRLMSENNDKYTNCLFTIEHVIPERQDPRFILDFENLLPICSRCNNFRDSVEIMNYIDPRKRDKLHNDFYYGYTGIVFPKEYTDNIMINAYGINTNKKSYSLIEDRREFKFQLLNKNFKNMLKLEGKDIDEHNKAIIFYDMYLKKMEEEK